MVSLLCKCLCVSVCPSVCVHATATLIIVSTMLPFAIAAPAMAPIATSPLPLSSFSSFLSLLILFVFEISCLCCVQCTVHAQKNHIICVFLSMKSNKLSSSSSSFMETKCHFHFNWNAFLKIQSICARLTSSLNNSFASTKKVFNIHLNMGENE